MQLITSFGCQDIFWDQIAFSTLPWQLFFCVVSQTSRVGLGHPLGCSSEQIYYCKDVQSSVEMQQLISCHIYIQHGELLHDLIISYPKENQLSRWMSPDPSDFLESPLDSKVFFKGSCRFSVTKQTHFPHYSTMTACRPKQIQKHAYVQIKYQTKCIKTILLLWFKSKNTQHTLNKNIYFKNQPAIFSLSSWERSWLLPSFKFCTAVSKLSHGLAPISIACWRIEAHFFASPVGYENEGLWREWRLL